MVDTKRYREISAQNRAQALHLLRVAAANDQSDVGTEILPAIMILLILAAVRLKSTSPAEDQMIKGETLIIPSFLEQTSSLLAQAVTPTDVTFVPTISGLHSLYTALYSLSAQKQIDTSSLFPNRDSRPCWAGRAEAVMENVAGMVNAP